MTERRNEPSPLENVRKLYPHPSDRELADAASVLDQYILLAKAVHERTHGCEEPDDTAWMHESSPHTPTPVVHEDSPANDHAAGR